MMLEKKYLKDAEALKLKIHSAEKRSVAWRSPSNIALIKYWGKKPVQIPMNPSLSFTLSNSVTETRIRYSIHPDNKLKLDFRFDGSKNEGFESRVKNYLLALKPFLPFLDNLDLQISSANSFPHSSGVASSASSMSALALCLSDIEHQLFNTLGDEDEFYQKSSFLARLGSGSACRSVYGGFVLWGKHDAFSDSSNETGIRYGHFQDSVFSSLSDAILITSKKKKEVSSSAGHGLMKDHFYADTRYRQAKHNLVEIDKSIRTGNEQNFISIVESEALSLHGLMLSSFPGYNLLNDNTWEIIYKIRKYRADYNKFITFTLDAGPNVHCIYMKPDSQEIEEFINSELSKHCVNGYWINDKIGHGPERIVNDQ